MGTPYMTSAKMQHDFNIILDDTCLEKVKFTKFLGLLIDENLTWKCHIDCVSKTLLRNISAILTNWDHFQCKN